MIPRKKKPCKCGKHEGYLFSHGYTKECWLRVNPPKRIKPLSEKRKERIKGGKGELKMMMEIWDERPHVCEVTGEPIKEFSVWCFMHVLSKGAFPRFRLKKENVLLVLPWVHDKYDNGDRSHPMFKEVNRLHDKLESEYYEETRVI